MLFESNTEIERISVMRGSRWVLVEVVLFQLKGHGHPQDDATPNFFPNSKGSILGLSNEVSFVSEFSKEYGQNSESIFQKTGCTKISKDTSKFVEDIFKALKLNLIFLWLFKFNLPGSFQFGKFPLANFRILLLLLKLYSNTTFFFYKATLKNLQTSSWQSSLK